MIPILGQAPGGGVAMVSPGNTLICLTQSAPGCPKGEPKSLYPAERRNYARVVPNDAYQGRRPRQLRQAAGHRRSYVLYAGGDPTSLGQARTFRGAAEKLGIESPASSAWNTDAQAIAG